MSHFFARATEARAKQSTRSVERESGTGPRLCETENVSALGEETPPKSMHACNDCTSKVERLPVFDATAYVLEPTDMFAPNMKIVTVIGDVMLVQW